MSHQREINFFLEIGEVSTIGEVADKFLEFVVFIEDPQLCSVRAIGDSTQRDIVGHFDIPAEGVGDGHEIWVYCTYLFGLHGGRLNFSISTYQTDEQLDKVSTCWERYHDYSTWSWWRDLVEILDMEQQQCNMHQMLSTTWSPIRVALGRQPQEPQEVGLLSLIRGKIISCKVLQPILVVRPNKQLNMDG